VNTPSISVLVAIGVVVVVGVIGAVVQPSSTVQIIGFCSFVSVSLFSYLRQENAAVATASKVEEVKVAAKQVATTLETTVAKQDEKLTSIAKTGRDTHTLVNSNMGVQLRLNAELSRWKANETKLQIDKDAADLAEKLLDEHLAKQATVDERDKKY